MQSGCCSRPRRGLFLLPGVADEPQMDDQLLWIPQPGWGEGGVPAGRRVYFEVCRSKERLSVKVSTQGHIFYLVLTLLPLARLPGGSYSWFWISGP